MKSISVKYLFLVILIISIPFIVTAQSVSTKKKKYSFVSLTYGNGKILPTNEFVKGANQFGRPMTNYQSATIKLGWQNTVV